ncbi:MAG: Holliday junction resolvase RuvX [Pseudomonadota bacterium]
MTADRSTIFAFDFGLRQIGVAVGNRARGSSEALTVLKAKEGQPDWQALEALIDEWQPAQLIVGEPLNMDGSDSELAERARKFGRRLNGRLGLPVAMMDERLSSFEAKSRLQAQGHRGDYRRAPADAEAAALILASWLREQPSDA